MRDTRKSSPFAAKSQREQLEQWICWQNQHPEAALTNQLPEPHDAESPVQQSPAREAKPTTETTPYRPRHSQYDAVVNRMRHARKQAAKDPQWSG